MIRRLLKSTLAAVLVTAPAFVHGQETNAKEEERLQALQKAGDEWQAPRNKVSVSFRLLNSGGRVDFKDLGTVQARTVAPASDGNVTRVYDNGTVSPDGLRSNEKDENGNQITIPGSRYQTYSSVTVTDYDANGNATGTHIETKLSGDFPSFTPGLTRNWSVDTIDQMQNAPGYLTFSNYSTKSEGGALSKKAGATMGVELQMSRDMGRLTRHIDWGFSSGVTLNSINSKTTGSVTATLNSTTDYYLLSGPLTPSTSQPYSSQTFNALYDTDGVTLISDSGKETTVPLSVTPDTSKTTTASVAGGTTVNGRWQVRGAYLMFKFGPSIHAQFTESLGLSGSIGLAGAYAGTTYTANETFTVAGLYDFNSPITTTDSAGNTTTTYPLSEKLGVTDPQTDSRSKFLTGYYADLTLEWATNETTSIFGGFTAQQLSSYDQKIPVTGQLAHIDLGSAVGLRGGISIRF